MSATSDQTIQMLAPETLREADDNPRAISDPRFEDLKKGLEHAPDMMQARPIIVDAERGDVVCGNMRLRAVKELGWPQVPVYFKTFRSEAERTEWMLRDNNEFGGWVPDEVASLVANYVAQGHDGALLGFGEDEIAAAVRRATGDAIIPTPGAEPDPQLASEVVVEIRCTRSALDQIQPILEDWQEIPGLELAIVGD